MAAGAVNKDGGSAADMLVTRVFSEGSAGHPYARAPQLLGARALTSNLADAVHYLCVLHGPFPSVIDVAIEKHGEEDSASAWLADAARGFTAERAYLTRLVVAAGPLPSTPGQAEAEAAVLGQRHALETLARSDRAGCALGAAIGLVLDWRSMRLVLDFAARRLGLAPVPAELPSDRQTREAIASVATSPGSSRALTFGAQQILIQHRSLWDLLETREQARSGR